MSIFEYDEEKHMKSERKEWREIGREEGSDSLAELLRFLSETGKTEEINRVLYDSNYRKKMLKQYLQEESHPI